MSDKKLSRRAFLRRAATFAGVAAVGSLAATCGPTPTPEVIEKIVRETVVVKEEVVKEVTKEVIKEVVKEVPAVVGEVAIPYITPLWAYQKLGFNTATEQYNMLNRGKVNVKVDPAPDGWEIKVREMIKKGEVKWDGALCNQTSYGGEIGLVKLGIIEDPTPYVEASTIPWAKNFYDDLTDTIKKFFTYEGKVWYVPWDTELYVRHYRTDEWGQLGEKPAETLAEWEKQLYELKKMFPDKVPLTIPRTGGYDGTCYLLMKLWDRNVYVQETVAGREEWVFNAKSEAYANVLNLYQKWYKDGIFIDEGWDRSTFAEVWNRGDALSTISGAAWCFATARKVWGYKAIDCEPPPVLEAGTIPQTTTFSNGASLFKGCKHPQEVVDWLLWMIDPTVEEVPPWSFYNMNLGYYHVPAFKSAYTNIVPKNPEWEWIGRMLPTLENSEAIPAGTEWRIQTDIMEPWRVKCAHGDVSVKEAQENIYNEILIGLEKFVKGG